MLTETVKVWGRKLKTFWNSETANDIGVERERGGVVEYYRGEFMGIPVWSPNVESSGVEEGMFTLGCESTVVAEHEGMVLINNESTAMVEHESIEQPKGRIQ